MGWPRARVMPWHKENPSPRPHPSSWQDRGKTKQQVLWPCPPWEAHLSAFNSRNLLLLPAQGSCARGAAGSLCGLFQGSQTESL